MQEKVLVRLAAADALGRIGDPRATETLEGIILRDEFKPIHEAAKKALENVKRSK